MSNNTVDMLLELARQEPPDTGPDGAQEPSTVEQLLSEAATELENLRSIVQRLPHCWRLDSEGQWRQDVPVVPGTDYVFDKSGVALAVFADRPGQYWAGFTLDTEADPIEWERDEPIDKCYATLSDARAKKEADQLQPCGHPYGEIVSSDEGTS